MPWKLPLSYWQEKKMRKHTAGKSQHKRKGQQWSRLLSAAQNWTKEAGISKTGKHGDTPETSS